MTNDVEQLLAKARELKEQLHAVEQRLFDLNVNNYYYLTGVHKPQTGCPECHESWGHKEGCSRIRYTR